MTNLVSLRIDLRKPRSPTTLLVCLRSTKVHKAESIVKLKSKEVRSKESFKED